MLFIEAHSISAYFIPNDILSCQGLFLFKKVYFANIASFFFYYFFFSFFLNYPISETLSTLCFVLRDGRPPDLSGIPDFFFFTIVEKQT